MFLIGKPTQPSCTFHWCVWFFTCKISGNVIPKRDILRADQRAIIIVECQRIFFRIIIEVETGVCVLITIFAKVSTPGIRKRTIGPVLIPAVCRSITCFGITFYLIPVIYITQIVIPHVNRLDTTIRLAVVCRRRIAFCVVLQPVLKVLVVTSIITVMIYIYCICRAIVRTYTE